MASLSWFSAKERSSSKLLVLIICILGFSSFQSVLVLAGNFKKDFNITWGDGRAKILNNGKLLTLSLDKASGCGIQSKNEYLFAKIDMQLKLVPRNSAGTVTAYYVSNYLGIFFTNKVSPTSNVECRMSKSFVYLIGKCLCYIVVIITRAKSWWNRLWIFGQLKWWPLHCTHKCLHSRSR